jgi:hypothetical protein
MMPIIAYNPHNSEVGAVNFVSCPPQSRLSEIGAGLVLVVDRCSSRTGKRGVERSGPQARGLWVSSNYFQEGTSWNPGYRREWALPSSEWRLGHPFSLVIVPDRSICMVEAIGRRVPESLRMARSQAFSTGQRRVRAPL